MQYKLQYGKKEISFSLDSKHPCKVVLPKEATFTLTGGAEVVRALNNPIRSKKIGAIVRPGEKTVIVTSDISRPLPSQIILPPLLAQLHNAAGIRHEDITIVLALGIHRGHTPDEYRFLLGDEIYNRYRCIDSNVSKCLRLGVCKNGTPVDVFSEVVKADRRICLGNTEYHYFAGYSGGMKAIMPGVSSKEAIQANHRLMVHPNAAIGRLEANPVREDIDEVADFLPVDFIVNVVLDEKKEIIHASAGHYFAAHRESCRFLDSLNKIEIPEQADVVIASPGGYPKDINLYQAQKALANAQTVVKEGGVIILAAACSEGYGEETFERWINMYTTPEQRLQEIQRHFELGGHKAAAIAIAQQKASIFLVSDLDDDLVKKINMYPFRCLQAAVDQALSGRLSNASLVIMPQAGSVLPVLTENRCTKGTG
ncbi:MAG: nickel-dependent lactate racemase [Gracilibacteraceae bacterium]|jgi:nickel-dependent lactate racemase|nr:nickel-dependent lactate racemase [Gracilibacteraceae bacterium]